MRRYMARPVIRGRCGGADSSAPSDEPPAAVAVTRTAVTPTVISEQLPPDETNGDDPAADVERTGNEKPAAAIEPTAGIDSAFSPARRRS
jgi:hypothetical protein